MCKIIYETVFHRYTLLTFLIFYLTVILFKNIIYWSKVLTDQQGLCRFFRKHENSKKSENSDSKTGDYSSFKFTKTFFSEKVIM